MDVAPCVEAVDFTDLAAMGSYTGEHFFHEDGTEPFHRELVNTIGGNSSGVLDQDYSAEVPDGERFFSNDLPASLSGRPSLIQKNSPS